MQTRGNALHSQAYVHLYSLCQTWLNLKTHTVSETENRTYIQIYTYKGGGDCCMQTTSLSACLDAAAHTRKTCGGGRVLAHAPWAAHAQWVHSLSFVNVVCRPHAVPAAHVTVFQTWAQKVGLVLEEVTVPYIQPASGTIKHLSFVRGALWASSQVRQGRYPLLPHLRPTMGIWEGRVVQQSCT